MNRKEHMQNSGKFYTMAGNYYFLLCISANISSHEVQSKAYFLDNSNVTISLLTPDGQHQNQTEYILCSQRWRSSIQ